MATTNVPVTLDTPIVVKILFRGQTKKFRLPLKDLGANVLPDKLRNILQIQPDQHVVFERYSDSAASYVTLDSDSPQVYKTLFRAAKAKLKLRLRATIPAEQFELPTPAPPAPTEETREARSTNTLFTQSAETLTPQVDAPVSPVIARSPGTCPPAPKFEPVSPMLPSKPVDTEGEAPVPRSFTARQSFFNNIANANSNPNSNLAFRPKPANVCTSWVVYCNNCNQPMENEHFHCSVCDGGDYDLCPACVELGTHCPGSDHWMVKRFVKNGCVVNSTTQRIAPKGKAEERHEVPGAFTDEKQPVTYTEEPTRTCNSCVKILPEKEFVTCASCEDYDLCMVCHIGNKHGHHPAHTFTPATETVLSTLANVLCNSGRNVRHSAVCDGCDKFIYGVRHKCLNCPDWDYCPECVKNAKFIHPRHRFVPIYEPLAEPLGSTNRHYGIFCDGPLCKDKDNLSYIEGIRYKCAVCHDTDFCQNCEAHPTNKHNHTHPLIKFKTPVRSVSVTTVNDDHTGRSIATLGDRQPLRRSTATETTPTPSANAATQVQTIVDMKPSEEPQTKKEKIAIRDLLVDSVEPVQEKVVVNEDAKTEPVPIPKSDASQGLDAHFIRDTIFDGSEISAGLQFVQVWTLRNPGPKTWPSGCSVRHVGGDNMLNVDNSRPLSHADLRNAIETNVIDRAVEVGEEVSFRVVMKAPVREGTAISYWRLKNADGIPFGHRLWCDINVVAPTSPMTATSTEAPATSPQPASASSYPLPYEGLIRARLERMKMMGKTGQQPAIQQNQNMEHIQRVRKAAVERLLENRRKEQEAALAAIKSVPTLPVKETKAEPTAELPVEEKPVERVVELQSSGMIFPQLDKESPESSTIHTATATAQPQSPQSEKNAITSDDDEFFEDAESVTVHSDDEGFMTDEEYDILDASDEEIA